jgi:putative transposase
MPRVARVVIPGVPHHVTQRGNNRQDVFYTDDDRRHYLRLLGEQSHRVLGYCLITNHVHLVVVPEHENSLARAIGRTHYLYTLYINRMHSRSGHLWQNRFFSCGLDEKHAYCALRYVELNPVRARIKQRAWT